MKDRIGEIETDNHPPETATRRALTLDVEHYQSYLDECDLSEDERCEFLEALWTILVGFVDLGYEIQPEKPDNTSCGKPGDTPHSRPPQERDVVELPDKPATTTFNAAADALNDQQEREES